MSRSPRRDARSRGRAGRTFAAASGGGGGGGFTPASLAGTAYWLRARDLGTGSFTTWADQSKFAYTATSTGTAVAAGATPSGGKAAALTSGVINLGGEPVGKVFASSFFDTSTPVANLIDGNTSTRWASGATGGVAWIALRVTSYAATSYSLTPYASTLSDAPTAWTFQAWNGTSWVTLDTQTGISGWAASTAKVFNFTNSTAYTLYRLNVTAAGGTYCQLTEFSIPGATLATPAAELWMVVKSGDTSGQNWQLGNSGQTSHFTFSGTVYETSFVTARQSFTPSPTVAGAWRLYRLRLTSSGAYQAWIDNTSQMSTTGLTFAPALAPTLANSWTGQYAEALIIDTADGALTTTDVNNLIAYFNSEHGLTVT